MNIRTYLAGMLFLFPACMKSSPDKANPVFAMQKIVMEDEKTAASFAYTAASPSNTSDNQVLTPGTKIIQTAQLEFTTSDFNKSRIRVNDSIKKYGGLTITEKQEKAEYLWQNDITARIPADKLDITINALEAVAGSFQIKSVSSADVTKQYIDTDARMRTQQALELRYLQLLQKAGNVSEMLEIEEKLSEVRATIESAKADLKLIDDQVAYSTLTIRYSQVFKNTKVSGPGFRTQASDSVKDGWDNVVATVLGFITAWPVIIVVIIIFIFVRRWIKRRRLRKQAASRQ